MKQGLPINPTVLRWARESAGYSLEQEIAEFSHYEEWENGQSFPSYSKLEILASRYKRPLAIFFFPQPPEEKKIEKAFRSLSEQDIENLSPHVRFLFRKAKAFQLNLQELYEHKYDEQKQKLSWLQKNPTVAIEEFASEIRVKLNLDLKKQKQIKDNDGALEYFRDILAKNGVYVFKDAFKNDKVSGFCIYDPLFPIIYVNNSVSKTRQIFTIFHELAHLLLNQDSIDLYNEDYLNPEEKTIYNSEWHCDLFSANFLVPDEDFRNELGNPDISNTSIEKLANKYKVSKEVILRKLLHQDLITREYFFDKLKEWKDSFHKQGKKKEGGGSYYNTQFAYLGKPYSTLVFEKYYQGRITKTEAAEYLNINIITFDNKKKKLVKTFDNMEHMFSLKGLT